MAVKTAIIRNEAGIHCRPSAVIVKVVEGYQGRIRIISEDDSVDIRSMMSILSLGLREGAEITIEVSGPEEESMCTELVDLFERVFDFPPRA
jgi:phosphotransferase system HPr (HPr) family protein